MEPFIRHTGTVLPLDRANVDTDAILPKQFLKSIKRTGFGEWLFFEWRYLKDGQPNPAFIMNKPPFNRATILLARNNFGCGSSREHAVWAIRQYGFRVVIAPRSEGTPAFADIFRNNCAKNGLLTVELSADEVDTIFELVNELPRQEVTVDLAKQQVVLEKVKNGVFSFAVDPLVKESLLNGLDDIGRTLKYEVELDRFEAEHEVWLAHE